LGTAEQSVLSWVQTYAGEVRFTGAGLLGKLRQATRQRTRILASIDSTAALETALGGPLPFGNVSLYVSGNLVTFTLDGTEYTIENLLPADVEDRLTDLLTRLGVTFATDGLTWDPATSEISDPFNATLGDVFRLVNPGLGIEAVFDTLLRGLREAPVAKLKLGPSFAAFRRRVLGLAGGRPTVAAVVAPEFIANLPELTELLSGGGFVALLRSPLIAGAIRNELGVAVGPLLAKFDLLRALNFVDISDAAIFLSELLQDALDLGTADAFGAGLDHFGQARFRAALSQARSVSK
jgi:hypothetical protein